MQFKVNEALTLLKNATVFVISNVGQCASVGIGLATRNKGFRKVVGICKDYGSYQKSRNLSRNDY